MMRIEKANQDGLIELHLNGKVTSTDYETVLAPALEVALADHDHVRVLGVVEDDVSFGVAAAWADMKLGMSHWRGFDRMALVADVGWITHGARIFAPIMPCPMQVFALKDVEAARRWLQESLGSIHISDLGGPALHIQLLGKLDPEIYSRAEDDLDARLCEHDSFRRLLDLREFDGWEGLSALEAHFSLVREHAPLVRRLAIIGKKPWQRMAERIARRFINAETKFFDAEDFDKGKGWLTI